MPTNTGNILQRITSKAGWLNGLITKENIKKPKGSKSSFQYYIAKNAFNGEEELSVDAIYFTDTNPVIYIKQLVNYNPNAIIKLQRKFWNECRTPLTLIITPDTIQVLDNYASPVNSPNEIKSIEKLKLTTSDADLERLSEILKQSKLDSEKVFGVEFELYTHQRVDKKLISQLRFARKLLHDTFHLDFETIHALLGRSLFTLYLEQRGILTKKDIKDETKVADSFFDLLRSHHKETYTLFYFLRDKFNGDLFPITDTEVKAVNNHPKILQLIYDCYTGEKELQTSQLSMPFHLFDFKHIPIELISAIYEEFMNEEDAVKNIIIEKVEKGKRELGAYYTPQMLVEFTYNEVLPMPSKNDCNYDIKILDPACGSGIFLVEGFKRIIERWKYKHNETELTKEKLNELLLNSIYGIEIHPEAIKITAFSLCLTFLHHMNPKKILQQVRFSPLIYWTKEKEVKQRDEKKFGLNLLQANTFIREAESFKKNPSDKINSFFDKKFDIVIGNPPWKRSNVDADILAWAKQNDWEIEKDIVKAFLAYAPNIAPNATVALISAAKVLFNTSRTDYDFRYRFFTENKVSVIANFAVVRNVLFEKAKFAAALIIYNARKQAIINQSENIIYCVPKSSRSIQNRNTISIDASEIKYLPIQEVLKTNSKIFKIAMYGNLRDLKFINRLNKMKSINEQKVVQGMGLIKDKAAEKKGNPHLGNNYFIDADDILPYYTPQTKTKLKDHSDYSAFRTDERDLYSVPLILFKEGTRFGELCCSYIDFDCAFLASSKAIKFVNKDVNFHKAFIACLNSSLATYYFISITSSWGVSKGGLIQKNEVSLFPAIPYYLDSKAIEELAQKVDYIISVYESVAYEDLKIKEKIKPIKDEIDTILYRELKITREEQALIENTVCFSNVIKENYKNCGAENHVVINKDVRQYAQTYLDVINKTLKNSSINLRAVIYLNAPAKEDLVCVKFIFEKNNLYKQSIEESTADISKELQEINESVFSEHHASIYYRRIIKYDVKDAFFLIKPNEKKFWTKAIALNDADKLIVEILNQVSN